MSDTQFAEGPAIQWNPGGTVGTQFYGPDSALNVTFHRFSERNGAAAIAAGGPAFVAKDYVKIFKPAEYNLWVVDREVEEVDKYRFPRQWQAYQDQRAQVPDGYPIDLLFVHEPDRVDICRSLKIFTIEQLAGLSEQGISKLGMGARELVGRAQEYLDKAGSRELAVAQQKVVDQQNEQIAAMQAQIAQLLAAQQGKGARV